MGRCPTAFMSLSRRHECEDAQLLQLRRGGFQRDAEVRALRGAPGEHRLPSLLRHDVSRLEVLSALRESGGSMGKREDGHALPFLPRADVAREAAGGSSARMREMLRPVAKHGFVRAHLPRRGVTSCCARRRAASKWASRTRAGALCPLPAMQRVDVSPELRALLRGHRRCLPCARHLV